MDDSMLPMMFAALSATETLFFSHGQFFVFFFLPGPSSEKIRAKIEFGPGDGLSFAELVLADRWAAGVVYK